MSKYLGAKWDVRDWTDDMKISWKNKMLEEGFSCNFFHTKIGYDYYWTEEDYSITFEIEDREFFLSTDEVEMVYDDVFPEELKFEESVKDRKEKESVKGIYIQFTTKDGLFHYTQNGNTIEIHSDIGNYCNVGGEEYFYYTTLFEISTLQKVEFEGRVRDLIYKSKTFMEKV
jgi:hypothetical protein